MNPADRGIVFTAEGDVTGIELEWRCETDRHFIHVKRRYRILATEEEKSE